MGIGIDVLVLGFVWHGHRCLYAYLVYMYRPFLVLYPYIGICILGLLLANPLSYTGGYSLPRTVLGIFNIVITKKLFPSKRP